MWSVRGVCETSYPGDDAVCDHHGQRLSLFCLDDLLPVCCECVPVHTHDGHRVYPVEEAVKDCRGELETLISLLQQGVLKCAVIKHTSESVFHHIQGQAEQTEKQIKEEFEKLHLFLREEEEARRAALREEEEEKRERMKEKCREVEEMMEFISDTMTQIERGLELDDVDFQEMYQDTVKRIWKCQTKPEKFLGSLIDLPEHVGNLRFKVWEKMLEEASHSSVTLDSNTASASLTVSPGLNRVLYSPMQCPSLPNVPERFHPYSSVLGSELILSGRRSWIVDVTDSTNWTLGVAEVSIKRKETYEACPEAGLWTISLRDDQYYAMTSPCERLDLGELRPRRIGMCVDWESGSVCFTDSDCDTHLYTFSQTFSKPLLPYFESICSEKPMILLQNRVSVIIQEEEVAGDDKDDYNHTKVLHLNGN
ncbi:E3 ubiquitin-protein ligase TRIM39 [Pangasianodon hypophthalmus]|uniref:E3 ubiquitin-protein ligase TRIM39 n=1 Tax=Pangasianodon hypophthalmus TaxID=310915 RepID=UPI00230782AA|nr:E3 ubiquitin-protein ligase TRIM39 [Pangasianodon hypophthalmus]